MTIIEVLIKTIFFGLIAGFAIFSCTYLCQNIRWYYVVAKTVLNPVSENNSYCLVRSFTKSDFLKSINENEKNGFVLYKKAIFVCWKKNRYQAILSKEIK